MKKFLAIIQARMGSTRLPGKSFQMIKGKPFLEHIIEGTLQMFDKSEIYVATTTNKEDRVIVDFCHENGIGVLQGDVEDVASRYIKILKIVPDCDYFFRICGDAPLYDYRIMERGKRLLENHGYVHEIVTSLPNKGYPQGQNLELISADAFNTHYKRFENTDQFEHVTLYFYQQLHKFKYLLVKFDMQGYYYEKYKFSVDTPDDLKKVKTLFEQIDQPHSEYDLKSKCALYDKVVAN